MSSAQGIAFLKGHGTENDFVLLPDLEQSLDLDAATVARICDRRAGVGADGVLRVVPARGVPAGGEGPRWFMDYRNADGSIAEMCGNGLRVFARYLVESGLEQPGDFVVATRAGDRSVHVPADGGDITAEMGRHSERDLEALRVQVGERSWPAIDVSMGNPHAVAFVDTLEDAGSLLAAPVVTPTEAYPDGVNVEFVVDRGPRHLAMRVHERGSGETRSCGTGACAVAVAGALRAEGAVTGGEWILDVPGGRLRVGLRTDGTVTLTGPAVIVARGELAADLFLAGAPAA
jgi:diaminopimelate epimerase